MVLLHSFVYADAKKVLMVSKIRENIFEMKFFQVREKSGNFAVGREYRKDSKSQEKVRELENLWLCQFSGNIFILFKGKKG